MKFLNKFFNYVIAVGLIGYGVFFYLQQKGFFKPKDNQVHVTNSSSVDVDRLVNQYLQDTNKKMARDQAEQKRIIEEAIRQSLKLKEKPVKGPEIPYEAQIHKNSESSVPAPVPPSNTTDNFDKKEYARQFIENARQGGYEIELSEDLQVIKATPIRKPSQEIDQVEILPSN